MIWIAIALLVATIGIPCAVMVWFWWEDRGAARERAERLERFRRLPVDWEP